MDDVGIGRLLIASLHQAIADVMPTRLAFYESWLKPPGLRDGKFGLAPLHATLSFLRLEGQPAYDQIMNRAGQYTADWAYLELSSIVRAVVRSLPTGIRARWALHLSRRLFKQTFRGSRVNVRWRKGAGTMEIRGSIFCTVRETAAAPLCGFYSAAVAQFVHQFNIGAKVQVSQCRAAGGDGCRMAVTILGESAIQEAAEAA